ncbi:hypothetical protein ACTWP5_11965 [Streptomyces sp. 4N509B]
MSTAPQPTTTGNQSDSPSTADQLREKVREANAQSEANRLSKGGK